MEYFTIDSLATMAGMILAVTILVQFTKGIVKRSLADYTVRLLALLWALALQFFVLYVQGQLSVETLGLGLINSIMVTLAATGAYELIADPAAEKKRIPL